MIKLPSRQVHLDFHTSELIPDVGARFDAAQFQEALKLAHLNSITVFAKGHHSWSYYPTQVGQPHPQLRCNLLAQQIEACHAIGVRAPIYYTVGWSAHDAEMHPEWLVRQRDGTPHTRNYDLRAAPEDPKPITSWKDLCPTGTYRQLILAQTREIVASLPVDGFFYDICNGPTCWCKHCRAGMAAEGIDPNDVAAAQAYNVRKWRSFMADCNQVILARWPEATIYYNGTVSIEAPDYTDLMTHYELEDLPTTWGGYDKFPIRAKFYARPAAHGKDYLAMSGKFHTTWGEFGGFKHPDAIRYEAAHMIAWGARCSFGDQLHPLGHADLETYRNIGQAYAYVEQIEEYGLDGQPCANLGLWVSGSNDDDHGVSNMLLETQTDFEVVDASSDLARYETVVLPGAPCLDETAAARLAAYVQAGGSVLALGESALDQSGACFVLDVGARYLGPAHYVSDYMLVGDALAEGLVRSPFLNYGAAARSELADGEVLAQVLEPYFDRTYGHYCSHQNTPNRPEPAAQPAAVRKGRVIWLAHRLGAIYYQHGARVHRDYFRNALALLHRQPVLSVQLPSAGRVNLVHQPQHRRYVAHVLYGPPLQRGRCLVIEDLVPLYDVPVALRVPEAVKLAYLAPQHEPLRLLQAEEGVAQVCVPALRCHQAVVFEY